MLDQEIRALRDDVDSTVVIPPFDDLVSRGHKRRRRTSTGIAVLALLAGGVAVGAGQVIQQNASTPPVDAPGVPKSRTADELIDSDGANVWWFAQPEPGLQYAVWGNECDHESCPLALTWSTDGWATREATYLSPGWNLPTWGQIYWTGTNFLAYDRDSWPYLLDLNGSRIEVSQPTTASPAQPGEVVIGVGPESIEPILLDPQSGLTHRVLTPNDIAVRQVEHLDSGELRLFGDDRGGGGVFATSTDGGVTWTRHEVPTTSDAAWFAEDEDHVVISRHGLTGYELTVSTDGGTTWATAEDTPFGGVDCFAPISGQLLISNGTNVYRSVGDSWLKFEHLADTPALQCVRSRGNALSATGADSASGLVSLDLGDTWQVIEPR